MNFNQKLIIGLSFGCLIFSLLVDTNDSSISNTSYSSIPAVVRLNGGADNRSSENIISVPPTPPLEIKVSKNSSSSVSNSKKNISTPQPGSNIRYFPNENPGGSGSGNNGLETAEWEAKSSCPNPDEIISNVDFWNAYLGSKNLCPNIDVGLDEDDDWTFEDIVEIPDEVLVKKRRRLLALQPTAKLDKPVQSQYTYSNSSIRPFSYYSKEEKILTIKNKELEKIVYVHSDDLDLLNFADRIVCPIQPDPIGRDRSINVDGYPRLDLRFNQVEFKTPKHGKDHGLPVGSNGKTPKTESNVIALEDSLVDMPNRENIVWYTDGQYQGGTARGCDCVNLFDPDTNVIAVYEKQSDGSNFF